MSATVIEWQGGGQLRAELAALGLPEELHRQISFRDSQVPDPHRGPGFVLYPPPWPGCCTPRGLGCSRIWGEFVLSEWITLAPWVFHPEMTGEIAGALDSAAAALGNSGPGSRTMWALDLLHPGEYGWLDHPVPAFAVDDLLQWGPQPLGSQLIAEVDAMLRDLGCVAGCGWGRLGLGAPNTESTYHGVRCFETTWWAGCR